jgi:glycosyltransferase involved in cell wall biosynthesis
VRYFEHNGHCNRGTAASRNLGLSQAKGDYIAQLDADDVWFPHTLEQQVAILTSHPEAAMVYGNRQYWRSWTGNPEDRDSVSEHGIESNTLVKPPTLLTLIYGLGKTSNPDSDVIFRRDIAIRLGGFEESFRGVFEDQVFLMKVFLNEAVFVSNECWTRYRQHPDSCVAMAIKSGQYRTARISFLLWIEEYLSQHGMKGTQVWETTQKALWVYRHPITFRLLSLIKPIARRILPLPIRRWG